MGLDLTGWEWSIPIGITAVGIVAQEVRKWLDRRIEEMDRVTKKEAQEATLPIIEQIHQTLMDSGLTNADAAKVIRWASHRVEGRCDPNREERHPTGLPTRVVKGGRVPSVQSWGDVKRRRSQGS